jgi:hypothetical protein
MMNRPNRFGKCSMCSGTACSIRAATAGPTMSSSTPAPHSRYRPGAGTASETSQIPAPKP